MLFCSPSSRIAGTKNTWHMNGLRLIAWWTIISFIFILCFNVQNYIEVCIKRVIKNTITANKAKIYYRIRWNEIRSTRVFLLPGLWPFSGLQDALFIVSTFFLAKHIRIDDLFAHVRWSTQTSVLARCSALGRVKTNSSFGKCGCGSTRPSPSPATLHYEMCKYLKLRYLLKPEQVIKQCCRLI